MTDQEGAAIALTLLAEALMTPANDISPDTRLGDARWDSLAHMRLMLAIEKRLARVLTPEEILAIETLDDVRRVLTQK